MSNPVGRIQSLGLSITLFRAPIHRSEPLYKCGTFILLLIPSTRVQVESDSTPFWEQHPLRNSPHPVQKLTRTVFLVLQTGQIPTVLLVGAFKV